MIAKHMPGTIVTSGYTYLDIDGYGGCIAYAELLRLQGRNAHAFSSATLNESITKTVLGWKGGLVTDYEPGDDDKFVLIDVSDPEYFNDSGRHGDVVEVIDHHPGHVDEWRDKIGDKADIRTIGAACTMIAERWESAKKITEISQTSARLLMTGILDNTLNFRAHVTTNRDKEIYDLLVPYANLPTDWPAKYFGECQQAIESDLETAIKNDVKDMSAHKGLPKTLGQIVIWDAASLLEKQQSHIMLIMREIAGSADWGMNIVSINEGRNYILAEDPKRKANLEKFLGVKFEAEMAVTGRLWMRKEIMQAAQDYASA
jgi:inorganic pyrophosphatase/manganese-dependent inorganic pyrophosphatase